MVWRRFQVAFSLQLNSSLKTKLFIMLKSNQYYEKD